MNRIMSPTIAAIVLIGAMAGQATGDSLAPLVERLRPQVVSIRATRPSTPAQKAAGILGTPGPVQGLGSGFIVDPSGLVVTSAHVVVGATDVKVVVAQGRTYRARVVGADEKTDVALLALEGARALPSVTLGDSDRVRVGDFVLAMGNPFGLGNSVTVGIVSAKGRVIGAGPYDDFLQTDAPINPGNSGGPLFNEAGEVVGISTAMVQNGQGIGFAVPVNAARHALAELRKKGRVDRGWIGVGIQDLTPELADLLGARQGHGALVAQVDPKGPAERSGVQVGDVILALDGKDIDGASRLPLLVAETPPGRDIRISLERKGRSHAVRVRVEKLPEPSPKGEVATPRQGPRKPTLGVGVAPRSGDGDAGVLVTDVDPAGASAGLLFPGDVILEIAKTKVASPRDVAALVERHGSRGPLLMRIKRGATALFVAVEVR
ncbi:MAG: trypsin-like peptidase domain-containing protein [Deltaproteobacteria bacterium]|nr:trypsin-like peptidase domain-containing protein [Deltaproteobacteria bacterium]